MNPRSEMRVLPLLAVLLVLTACGNVPFGSQPPTATQTAQDAIFNEMIRTDGPIERQQTAGDLGKPRQSIFALFRGNNSDAVGANVNRYLWNASLDALSFLPVETVDPFTGVISTGYGTPPGGGRAYRATIYISDPALDARSLKVAIQTRGGGPVSAETVRAVEDAILTRARELRIRDSRL